jgi:hypothetical protein
LGAGRDSIEVALDAERRAFMRTNEERLAKYAAAASAWAAAWPMTERGTAGLPLREAHLEMVRRAEGVLPFRASEESGNDG